LLTLGIVLILADRVRDPAFWRWLGLTIPLLQGTAGSKGIDNQLDAITTSKTHPDAFFSRGEHRRAKSAISDKAYFPGVEPAELDAIRDDTPSSRDEQTVSLRLLSILKKADPDALDHASLGPVTYAQLFRQPDQYRGQVVAVSGVVRRVNPIALFPNQWQIERYYQVWLWPSDNPSSPMIVYCLQLPKGFPIGMELAEEVNVTGIFFKRCAYQAKDGLRTAPEILASTLAWRRRPALSPTPPEPWAMSLVVVAAALASLWAAWYIYVRTRPTPPALPDRPPQFDKIENS
jgi:hypothetical protein